MRAALKITIPLASCLLASAWFSAADTCKDGVTLFPKGVAEPTGRIAFIQNGTNLDAIDLRTGDLRWRIETRLKPLLVVGRKLLGVQTVAGVRNAFELGVIDSDRGSVLLVKSSPIKLPGGISFEKHQSNFEIRA